MKQKYYVAGYRIVENEFSVCGISTLSMADALLQLNTNLNFKSFMHALKHSKQDDEHFSDVFHIQKNLLKQFPLVENVYELNLSERMQIEKAVYEDE